MIIVSRPNRYASSDILYVYSNNELDIILIECLLTKYIENPIIKKIIHQVYISDNGRYYSVHIRDHYDTNNYTILVYSKNNLGANNEYYNEFYVTYKNIKNLIDFFRKNKSLR